MYMTQDPEGTDSKAQQFDASCEKGITSWFFHRSASGHAYWVQFRQPCDWVVDLF